MSKLRTLLLSSAVAILPVAPSLAFAETAPASSVEEVVVTAQKREQRLQDVPVPVTSINTDSLVASNLLDVKDFYTSVPGLTVAPQTLGATVIIRGLAPSSGNPTVGITVDDVPFGASTRLGAGGVTPDFDPSDLERIEVLRGPQGTLYGANSLGGLLKYVTKDPSMAGYSGRIQVGADGVNNGDQPGYSLRASVNIPVSDTLAVRLSGFTRRDPGFIDNVQTGERAVNSTEASGGRVSVLWRPSEVFSLKGTAMIQHNQLDGSPYMTSGLGDLQQSDLRGTGKFTLDAQAYSLTGRLTLGRASLTAISGYTTFKSDGFSDFTFAFGGPTQGQFGVGGAALANPSSVKKFSQEVRFDTPIGSHIDLLVGGFYTHENSELDTHLVAVDQTNGETVGTWLFQPIFIKYNEYSAFSDLTLHVTDRFDIQLGARETNIGQDYRSFYTGPYVTVFLHQSDPFAPPQQSSSSNAFTYLFTPSFKVTPNLMVYARLASGYRPGGPNSNNSPNTLPNYNPDKTANYEVGIKGAAFDHMLTFDASAYHIDWKDIQLLVVDPVTHAAVLVNGGGAKSEGIELSAALHPTQGFTVNGSLALNNAVLKDDLPPGLTGTAVGLAGDRLPDSSPFSANVSLNQDFQLSESIRASLGLTESYVGENRGEFVRAGAARQVYPAYARTDLRADLSYQDWTVGFFVNNATDRRGQLPNTSNNPSAIYPIQPRTIGMNVSRTF